MNLNKSYSVKLYDNNHKGFVQFVECNNCDEALKKAKNTFAAMLHGLSEKVKASETQAACKFTKVTGCFRFGFKGGFVSVDCDNLTIFEALAKAKEIRFLKEDPSLEIEEIYQFN